MKQILYFILGVTLSLALLLPSANACLTCGDQCYYYWIDANIIATRGQVQHIDLGCFDNVTDLNSAITAAIAADAYNYNSYATQEKVHAFSCGVGNITIRWNFSNDGESSVIFGVVHGDFCSDCKYAIVSMSSCSGQTVGIEYVSCASLEGEPCQPNGGPGDGNVIGNAGLHYSIAVAATEGDTSVLPSNADGVPINVDYIEYDSGAGCTASEDYISSLASTVTYIDCGQSTDSDGDGIMDYMDSCPDTPPNTTVNEYGCEPDSGDSDGDGVNDDKDLCPGTAPGYAVDEYGCPDDLTKDSDGDGVPDSKDLCPSTPLGDTVGSNGCTIQDGDNVDNDDDSAVLEAIAEYGKKLSEDVGSFVDDIPLIKDSSGTVVTLLESQAEETATSTSENDTEAASGEAAWGSIDTSGSEYSGELVAGTDYEEVGELSEETWFTDFIGDNPLITAFESSGFQMTGAVCKMTLNLGYLGIHEIDICDLETGFQLAGNLLFGFTILLSLLMIVRS